MGDRSEAVRAAAAVAILLGGGYAVATTTSGSAEPSVGTDQPVGSAPAGAAANPTPADTPSPGHADHSHQHAARGDGTTATVAGYRMEQLRLSGDRLQFQVTDREGKPQTRFAVRHRKPLHLFVFADDLSEFRHVHPVPDAAGTWTVDVPDAAPGPNRVVAEFTPRGAATAVVLGGEVTAPGSAGPRPLPEPDTVVAVDGYTVRLVEDALVAGYRTQLRVRISGPDGRPAELAPYLGSWAHAALVDADSLAVTHLHPLEEYVAGAPSPRDLVLSAGADEPGAHRLVVEFATESGVHQAEFTVRAVA